MGTMDAHDGVPGRVNEGGENDTKCHYVHVHNGIGVMCIPLE